LKFDIVIIGLSVTSSWGNGHATTYRSLIRGLARRGHRILFLECDQPWYAGNRDEPHPYGAVTKLYESFEHLKSTYEDAVSRAELVIVGSFVPEGALVGDWVTSVAQGRTAFYDIDTPLTLAKLQAGEAIYVTPDLIRRYHCYLSFTGGPMLCRIEQEYGSPMARVLYCSVDPDHYRPLRTPCLWDLGYLGTYSDDRQPGLEALLLEPARRWPQGSFAVVGPGYLETAEWPLNVDRRVHLSPREHPAFYGAQRFGLNLTRSAMKAAGFSPSVRLFEAAACATPVISDWWDGLDGLFAVDREIFIAEDSEDVLRRLRDTTEAQRLTMGDAARRRILAEHTPLHRAIQLEGYLKEMYDYIPAHSSRHDGRRRYSAGGMDPGLELESERPDAGADAGATTLAAANPRRVHKSTGARP
jgi:spore maturation protein CgeB